MTSRRQFMSFAAGSAAWAFAPAPVFARPISGDTKLIGELHNRYLDRLGLALVSIVDRYGRSGFEYFKKSDWMRIMTPQTNIPSTLRDPEDRKGLSAKVRGEFGDLTITKDDILNGRLEETALSIAPLLNRSASNAYSAIFNIIENSGAKRAASDVAAISSLRASAAKNWIVADCALVAIVASVAEASLRYWFDRSRPAQMWPVRVAVMLAGDDAGPPLNPDGTVRPSENAQGELECPPGYSGPHAITSNYDQVYLACLDETGSTGFPPYASDDESKGVAKADAAGAAVGAVGGFLAGGVSTAGLGAGGGMVAGGLALGALASGAKKVLDGLDKVQTAADESSRG